MKHQIITMLSYMKWAWDFLLHFSVFHSYPLKACLHEYNPCPTSNYCSNEARECPVCLCKIEEGDEIRELRCDHVFHRECLDRWTDRGRATCPLCRDCLAPRRNIDELVMEIITFNYLSLGFTSDRDTWWLR